MAQSSLSVFSLPGFPQVLDSLLGREIERVEHILAAENFSTCSFESSESSYGASDGGFPCRKTATVHDIETGCGYCVKHFASEVAL